MLLHGRFCVVVNFFTLIITSTTAAFVESVPTFD